MSKKTNKKGQLSNSVSQKEVSLFQNSLGVRKGTGVEYSQRGSGVKMA
jgi:hypothetical protein